jgi:hypothetical protein
MAVPNPAQISRRRRKVTYIKVKGSRVKGNAQAIGEVIEDLKKQFGGKVPPRELVKVARDPKNPCHANFTWDNKKAADEFRLDQARHLLRSIIIMEVTREEVIVRPNVVCSRYGGQATQPYKDFLEVMKNPAERALYLECSFREFEAFRKKYERLAEWKAVFDAYDAMRLKRKAA